MASINEADSQIISDLETAGERLGKARAAIGRVIFGQDEVVEQVLIAILGGGHALLVGAPGLAKTKLATTLGRVLGLDEKRVQFTPDLMPADILGSEVLDEAEGGRRQFRFLPGPVFCQLMMADEINRASPRTQSALLQAMQEHHVTVAGQRHDLPRPFHVLATQNPIEQEGTYPLPEAQLDRFLLKVLVPTPTEDEMVEVLARTTGQGGEQPDVVLGQGEILELMALCRDVAVADPVMRYAVRLVRASEPSTSTVAAVKQALRYGAGVRGAQSLVLAAKAVALLEGRAHVSFGDVQRVAAPVLRHRLLRSFEGEADGISTDQVVAALVAEVPTRPELVEQAVRRG